MRCVPRSSSFLVTARRATPAFSECGYSYTFNNLQVTDGCVSPSKYVQVVLIMG